VRAPLLCRRYVVALLAACLAALAPPAAAQEKSGRSFADTATPTV